jgi:hypothetical protein
LAGCPALPRLGDYYNLPIEIPAAAPAVKVEGAKYCVKLSDCGNTNALPFGTLTPHICSAGNVAVGATTGIAGQGLGASIGSVEWWADKSVAATTPLSSLYNVLLAPAT